MKILYQTNVTLLLILFFSTNTIGQLENYTWELIETKTQPIGRHENAFVEFNGKFYLIGGRGIKPVEVFDPISNTWIRKNKTPFEIHHFQAVVYKNKIYVLGGMTGQYPNEKPLENIWIYDPMMDVWSKSFKIPLERQRGASGVVIYKDFIYQVAGIKNGHTSGTVNYFDRFNLKTGDWEILTDAPHLRDHFSAVVAEDKLFCIGGRNTSVHHKRNFTAFFGATISKVDYYDFKENTWYTLEQDLPHPSAAAGVVKIENFIIYHGGEGKHQLAYNDVFALDLKKMEWKQLDYMKTGRHGTHSIGYNSKIYVAAGSEKQGGGALQSIEVFKPISN